MFGCDLVVSAGDVHIRSLGMNAGSLRANAYRSNKCNKEGGIIGKVDLKIGHRCCVSDKSKILFSLVRVSFLYPNVVWLKF